MRENSSSVWAFIDSTVLAVYRPGALSDADIEEFTRDVGAPRDVVGAVILPADAIPSPNQRAVLKEWLQRSNIRVAVVTRSALARGVVTAMHWFGLQVRAFSVEEIDAALEFAGLALAQRGAGKAELRSLATRANNPTLLVGADAHQQSRS